MFTALRHPDSFTGSSVQNPTLCAKRIAFSLAATAIVILGLFLIVPAFGHAYEDPGPTGEIRIPGGYRDWQLISVAHEAANLNDIRAVLGNDVAINAYRDQKRPFPNGTIIARLAWKYTPSAENNKAFGREQSFVAGSSTNLQLMVKDSKKYATTGGWGFAQFKDGKSANEASPQTCFSCHEHAVARDFVFTRYAP